MTCQTVIIIVITGGNFAATVRSPLAGACSIDHGYRKVILCMVAVLDTDKVVEAPGPWFLSSPCPLFPEMKKRWQIDSFWSQWHTAHFSQYDEPLSLSWDVRM